MRKRPASPRGRPPARYTPGVLKNADRRTKLARAYTGTRDELRAALGGEDALSPQQSYVVDLVAETRAIRAVLFEQFLAGTPLDVAQFSMLSDKMIGGLKLIGMARRAKDADYLDTLKREYGKEDTQP